MNDVQKVNLWLMTGLLLILHEMEVPEDAIFSPTQRDLIQDITEKYESLTIGMSEEERRADLVLMLQTTREIGNRLINAEREPEVPTTPSSIILN